jgi:hypothetical protein
MFSAFDGFVTGRDLVVVPGRLLVQLAGQILMLMEERFRWSMPEFLHSLRRGGASFTDSWAAWMCEQLPALLLIDKLLSG